SVFPPISALQGGSAAACFPRRVARNDGSQNRWELGSIEPLGAYRRRFRLAGGPAGCQEALAGTHVRSSWAGAARRRARRSHAFAAYTNALAARQDGHLRTWLVGLHMGDCGTALVGCGATAWRPSLCYGDLHHLTCGGRQET